VRRRGRSEKDLRGSLKNNETASRASGGAGKAKKGEKVEQSPPAEKPFDYQLVRALDLLRGISLYREKTVN